VNLHLHAWVELSGRGSNELRRFERPNVICQFRYEFRHYRQLGARDEPCLSRVRTRMNGLDQDEPNGDLRRGVSTRRLTNIANMLK
jgi:hypothetical protein